jgi:hypothetical protein
MKIMVQTMTIRTDNTRAMMIVQTIALVQAEPMQVRVS